VTIRLCDVPFLPGNRVSIFTRIFGAAVEPSPLLLRQFFGLLYKSWRTVGDDCRATSGMNEWQGKPKYSEKTCPSITVSTTDPTKCYPSSNPGRCGGKPATNPCVTAYPASTVTSTVTSTDFSSNSRFRHLVCDLP
jgi:hypothetical protein